MIRLSDANNMHKKKATKEAVWVNNVCYKFEINIEFPMSCT